MLHVRVLGVIWTLGFLLESSGSPPPSSWASTLLSFLCHLMPPDTQLKFSVGPWVKFAKPLCKSYSVLQHCTQKFSCLYLGYKVLVTSWPSASFHLLCISVSIFCTFHSPWFVLGRGQCALCIIWIPLFLFFLLFPNKCKAARHWLLNSLPIPCVWSPLRKLISFVSQD